MGRIICLCNRVYARDLEKIIRKAPGMSVKEIIGHTGASSSCRRCYGEFLSTVNAIKNEYGSISQMPRQLDLPFPEN
ncbi:MAG: (2Fe-2S)-binding protein [Bacteroidota bacterium]